MLDDGHSGCARRIEFGDEFEGGVGVVDVVVRELLALHLPRGGDAETLFAGDIEARRLVRVFAVAHGFRELAADRAIGGRRLFDRVGEPVGDRRIVGGRARIGFLRELAACGEARRAIVGGQFTENDVVILDIDDDGDIVVVLGGGADHGGAADVDVLDAILVGRALRDSGLEGIEVHDEQIDLRDVVREHGGFMLGVFADREQAAVHLGMQRLDTAVHHFRKAGEIGYVDDLEAGIGQRLARAAGRDEFDAALGQRACEVDQAGLVGNGNQRAGDAAEVGRHGRPRACAGKVEPMRGPPARRYQRKATQSKSAGFCPAPACRDYFLAAVRSVRSAIRADLPRRSRR